MPNRLANEKSPYLLQHANNPVGWYPWGEEAFAKAKREDKPVFLSCGYSTCHWCHVMERESFESEEVADALTENFVAVKVDREERPDVDHFYMSACQLLTGSGGWPLTVFMTPDKIPFYAGTYFPKEARFGRPGLLEILKFIRQSWTAKRKEIEHSGREILLGVKSLLGDEEPAEPEEKVLKRAFAQLGERFDHEYGGFGEPPKFPAPPQLLFLLQYFKRYGDKFALHMVEKTLRAMYQGGIYDHIGFGFARYATDRKWLVPHFEKMLYDNALLAVTYLEAFCVTGNAAYGKVAGDVITYVLREMTDPAGGFYTACDADAEGVEGKFYLWTVDEVNKTLGETEGNRFCLAYDITPAGNFEGKNIPNLIGGKAGYFSGIAEGNAARLEASRRKLFAQREKRIHPGRDDKVLTACNGLMIVALARGAKILGNVSHMEKAIRSARFLKSQMINKSGRVLARFRDGEAAFPAYLDDYAFLAWGLIELYEATQEKSWLDDALELTRKMLDLFYDREKRGFFFTGQDMHDLPFRFKETYDGAKPSGNAAAIWDLLRLARLTGDEGLKKPALDSLAAFMGSTAGYPLSHCFYLCALDCALDAGQAGGKS